MKRIGESTLEFSAPPVISGFAAAGGKKESDGPLGSRFDKIFTDSRLGTDSWEQAEAKLQSEAADLAIQRAGLKSNQIHAAFAGDLLNQCTASTFGLRDLHMPHLGQYGACSTMAQNLLMSALFVESGAAEHALAVTGSHYCSAERQFRTPLEYGAQRTPTAQWTATAAGAVVLSREEASGSSKKCRVTRGLPGRIVDPGIKDPANMGAAMAPAAADSLFRFFQDTSTAPTDYDAIFTGDLGLVGSRLLHRLMGEGDNSYDLRPVHQDCGLLLYDREKQDVHAGGSGCGCSASVLCAHILPQMLQGKLHRILFCATGALLSTTSQQQGLSIPGICHVVQIESC